MKLICVDIYTFQKQQVVPNNRRSVYLSKNKEVILFTKYNKNYKNNKIYTLKNKTKMAKINVMKTFMPLRTNNTTQASAVQITRDASLFAVACGPGVDIFHLDHISESLMHEKSFTLKYLGQMWEASNRLTMTVAIKFTAKPGILAAAVLHLETSMPKVEIILKDIKVDPTHGIIEDGENLTTNSTTPLRLHNVANGTFVFPEASNAELFTDAPHLAVHPHDSVVVLCSRMDSGKIHWLDFADETILHTERKCTGSFIASNSSSGITLCEFSPCGQYLVSIDTTNIVRIWKFSRSRSPSGIFQPTFEIHSVLSSGRTLPTMGSNNNSATTSITDNKRTNDHDINDFLFQPKSLSWIVTPNEKGMNNEFILCGGKNGSVILWELERKEIISSASLSTRTKYAKSIGGLSGITGRNKNRIQIEEKKDCLKFFPKVHGKEKIEHISHAILSDGRFNGEMAWAVSYAASSTSTNDSTLRFWPFGGTKKVQDTNANIGGSPNRNKAVGRSHMDDANAKTPSRSYQSPRKNHSSNSNKKSVRPAFGIASPTNRSSPSSSSYISPTNRRNYYGSISNKKKNKNDSRNMKTVPTLRDVLSSHSIRVNGHVPRGLHIISTPGFTNTVADKIYDACVNSNIPIEEQGFKNGNTKPELNGSFSSTILLVVTDQGITITIVSGILSGKSLNESFSRESLITDGLANIAVESDDENAYPDIDDDRIKQYSYETNKEAWAKHDVGSFTRRYRLPNVPNYDYGRDKVGRQSKKHTERIIELHKRVANVEHQLKDIKKSFSLFATDVNHQMASLLNIVKSLK